MSETLQVRKRGVVTLPAELRQKYNIQEGDSYRVLDLDGIFVLTPMVPMVPELAREIEKLRLRVKELGGGQESVAGSNGASAEANAPNQQDPT